MRVWRPPASEARPSWTTRRDLFLLNLTLRESSRKNDHDEYDDTLEEVGRDVTMHGKWEKCLSCIGLSKNGERLADVCNHVQIKAPPRSEAEIGGRGAGGERLPEHEQREFEIPHVRWSHGEGLVGSGQDGHSLNLRRPRGDVVPLRGSSEMRSGTSPVFTRRLEPVSRRCWSWQHQPREK